MLFLTQQGPGFVGDPRIIFSGTLRPRKLTVTHSDPEAIKTLLSNNDEFIKYPGVYDIVSAYLGDGLVCTPVSRLSTQS
jgi:hypothetical protein